jgi:GNAT superfamily N-acetyltransferase
MGVLVRRAGRRDLEAVHGLWQELRELEAKAGMGERLGVRAEDLAREHRELILADPRTAILVAEEQGRVLGYAHAQIETNDPVYLPERFGVVVDLMVCADRRREKIGSRLFEACREWLTSRGVAELRVHAPVGAEDAQRFFESLGCQARRLESRLAL